jgi:hypothetical protein
MSDLPWIITITTKDGRTVNYLQYGDFGRKQIISGEKADELIEQQKAKVFTTITPRDLG